jgi:hypothetical protein
MQIGGGPMSKAALSALARTTVKELGTVWNATPTRDPAAPAVTRITEDDAAPNVGARAITGVLYNAGHLHRSDNRGTVRRRR